MVESVTKTNDDGIDPRMVGEVLEKDGAHFFVEFKGKQCSYFSSRIGAQTYLDMLRDNLER